MPEKRTRWINFRVNDHEAAVIKEWAKRRGVAVGVAIRATLMASAEHDAQGEGGGE